MSTQPSRVITCLKEHTQSKSNHSKVWYIIKGVSLSINTLNLYLKNGNPCISNVIKVNSSFVRVYFPSPTLIVKLVPVYTWHWFIHSRSRYFWTGLLGTQEAGCPSYAAARHIGAPKHPVLSFRWADEGVVIGAIWPIVATQEGNVVSPGEEEGEWENI